MNKENNNTNTDNSDFVKSLFTKKNRKTRTLATCAITSWMLVIGLLVGCTLFYIIMLHPVLTAIVSNPHSDVTVATIRNVSSMTATLMLYSALAWATALALGVFFSAWYMLTSRKIALKQIGTNLQNISTQLAMLTECTTD